MSAKQYVPNSGGEHDGMGFPLMPPPQLRMPNDPDPHRGKGMMPPQYGGYANPFVPPASGGNPYAGGGQGIVRPGVYPWRG